MVWGDDYSDSQLARQGLSAYSQHPLLRTVSLDRSFYRPLSASEFVQPALDGLGSKIGALVFQLSAVPAAWLARMDELLDKIAVMLGALPQLRDIAPGAVVAVEVRNPEFITPAFASMLKAAGATYCLGLHPKMPPIEDQLPMLRALWPGPLVCRWSLNSTHGSYGYEEARDLYQPFELAKAVDLAGTAIRSRTDN